MFLLQSNYVRYRDFAHVSDFMISARTFHSFKTVIKSLNNKGPGSRYWGQSSDRADKGPLLMGVPFSW